MQKNKVEDLLKRLEDLNSELTDDSDPDELMGEINKVVDILSKDVELDLKNKGISAILKFINISDNPDPCFAYEGDSGFDLRAYVMNIDGLFVLDPGKIISISTGLYFEIQKGLEVQIRPRSGLAAKYGITIVNSPGTVDSHYRGEIKIILANLGEKPFVIKNGDRIAQAVVCPVYGEGNLNLEKVKKLSETERGIDGIGSTGLK